MTRSTLGVLASLIGSTVLFAGCGGSPSSSPSPSASTQPKTLEAAIAAQQEKQDRGQAGDFAGEWLLFTKKVRDRLSQADYVAYGEACYSINNPVKVTGGRMEGQDKAIVRLELPGSAVIRTMTFEDGQWVQEPLDDWYEKPVSELIAECQLQTVPVVTEAPKKDSANEPFSDSEEFEKYYDEANAAYEPCKDAVLGFADLKCRSAIVATVEKLRNLEARLPADYTETGSATKKQIDELQGFLDCQGLWSATDPDGCPLLLTSGQLLPVGFAWYEDRRNLGLDG